MSCQCDLRRKIDMRVGLWFLPIANVVALPVLDRGKELQPIEAVRGAVRVVVPKFQCAPDLVIPRAELLQFARLPGLEMRARDGVIAKRGTVEVRDVLRV